MELILGLLYIFLSYRQSDLYVNVFRPVKYLQAFRATNSCAKIQRLLVCERIFARNSNNRRMFRFFKGANSCSFAKTSACCMNQEFHAMFELSVIKTSKAFMCSHFFHRPPSITSTRENFLS